MNTPQTDPVRAEIGSRLRDERKRLGLTVEAVTSEAKVGRSAYFSYEGGSATPGADVLARLADHGFDVQFIVTGHRGVDAHSFGRAEAELVARLALLPPRLQETIRDVLALAEAAYIDRKEYHHRFGEGEFTYGLSKVEEAPAAHEPPPAKRVVKR